MENEDLSMTNELEKVLSLPLVTLAVIAAGYLGYRLAYTGKDARHSSVDVVFFVCVFGFAAKMVGALSIWGTSIIGWRLGDAASSLAGIVGALVIAATWRRWGEIAVFRALRGASVSSARRLGSAWSVVVARPDLKPTILMVSKTDGSQLLSEGMSQFNELPFGSCVLGEDGSIAMYVTHCRSGTDQEWAEVSSGLYADWGAEVTVIPANQISHVSLRTP